MKTEWLVPAVVLVCSLATVVACAERVTAPGGSFAFDLPGEWVREEPVEGLTVWQSTDPDWAAMGVLAVGVVLNPDKPVTAQLVDLIKDPEQEFTDARNFRTTSITLLGQLAEFISFVFTDDGTALQAHVLPVPCGQMHTALMVLGPAETQGLEEAAHAVFCSIGPPGAAPAAPGGAPPEPPAGGAGQWKVADLEEGIGVRFWEEQQPGVSGEIRVLPHGGKRASQLLPPTLTAVLGARPQVQTWGRSQDDRYASCTFRVTRHGTQHRGEAFLSVGPNNAAMACMYAPEGTPEARVQQGRQFMRRLCTTSGEGGPAIDPATVPLTRTANTDGSAWIDVPRGWQVGETQGILSATGPEGSLLVGMHGAAFTPAGAAQTAAMDGGATAAQVGVSEYLPPTHAPLFILPKLGQIARQPVDGVQLLEAAPVPNAAGFAWVHCTFRRALPTGEVTPMEGIAFVSSSPDPTGNMWNWTITLIEAKQADFPRVLPLLMRIYGTYGVSPALIAERLDNIRRIQDETHQIIQQVIQSRSEASEIAAKKWDRYIRDTEPLISQTGEVREIGGLMDLLRWVGDDPNLAVRQLGRDEWLKHVP